MTKAEIDILKKALFIAGQKEVEAYKSLPDEEVTFSKEFEEKIQAINKRRKSFIYRATKTVPRKIAVILVAAVITLSLMMSVSAIRTPVLKFVATVYDTFINIFIEEDDGLEVPTSIEYIYMPSYIPVGYISISSQNYGNTAKTIWMKENYSIVLTQDVLQEETKATINNEKIKYQTFLANNNTVYYFTDKETCTLLWTNNEYLFALICPENMPLDEIEKIIVSME